MNSIGYRGERFVHQLLEGLGYTVTAMPPGWKTVDLTVSGGIKTFRVSVKTSNARRHVRMGPAGSISQLSDKDFLFALLPLRDRTELRMANGGYDLLIIPGKDAREDGLLVHESWLSEPKRDGTPRSGSFGVTVKGYSKRPIQVQVWAKWQKFRGAWELLPVP